MYSISMLRVVVLLCALLCSSFAVAQIPAFPGAKGFGAGALGGRGGEVIYVTNLNDAGPGSLRSAIEASGPRTIIFRVGGTILLEDSLRIVNPQLTIAGQTAPGDGITLRLDELETGPAILVLAEDVIIRHIRIRVGAASVPECCRDAITFFDGADRVIVDHVSASWGTDENINAWGTARNITIQHSIISEALLNASHSEQGVFQRHSMGALFGDRTDRLSLYHNLFAHNNQRNPLINSIIGGSYESVNNVIYNWGDFGSVFAGRGSDPLMINHIGNLYIAGERSRPERYEVGVQPDSSVLLYVRDNIGPNRSAGDSEFDIVGSDVNFVAQAPSSFRSLTPFPMSSFPISPFPVNSILSRVAEDVGANLPRQDSIDQRIINEVIAGEGSIIDDPSEVGGWINALGGTPYVDNDADGMSDNWETFHRLDPTNSLDRNNDEDNDGYTNLEEFLNSTNPIPDAISSPEQTPCFPIKNASGSVSLICL